jgi:hypothetical protein
VSRVIYGAIIGLALIVALEAHSPGIGSVIATLLGTAVAVALAELYSEVLGHETRTRHRITRRDVAPLLEDAGAVAFGVAFPAGFFVLAMIGVLEVETAFTVAKWSGLGLIGFYGYWAARFAGAPRPRALAQAAAVALVGGFLIALKAVLH